jgi:hypothetical protein
MNRRLAKLVNRLFLETGDMESFDDYHRGYYSALNDLSVSMTGIPLEPSVCNLDGCNRLFVFVGSGYMRKYCCNSHKTLAYLRRQESIS